ncbi:MAG: hypothetical protein GX647_04955 [Clostridiales bacterium]|jgi:ribosomal protein L37AE/L43A|nr:hypothetical protein [Clostridiales bacterium]
MKHATLSCPSCGTAIDLKVVFNRIGFFRCHVCGTKGLGPLRPPIDGELLGDKEVMVTVREEVPRRGE